MADRAPPQTTDAPGGVAIKICALVAGVFSASMAASAWLVGPAWISARGSVPPGWLGYAGSGVALVGVLAYLWARLRPVDVVLAQLRANQEPGRKGAELAAKALVVPVVFLVTPMAAGLLAAAWALLTGGSDRSIYLAAGVSAPFLATGLVVGVGMQRILQPAVAALGFSQVPVTWRFGLRLRLAIAFLAIAVLSCSAVVLLVEQAASGYPDDLPSRGHREAGLAVAFACLVAALVGGLFSAGIRRRVRALTERLAQMADQGNVQPGALPVASATEVGAIAAAFNRLVSGLERKHRLLASYTQKVQYAERSRAKFLRTMSHELRTPLNSIIGFSDLLGREFEGPLTERQHEAVAVINRSGERLLEMINDILLMAQFEANRAVADCRPIRLDALVDEALESAGGSDPRLKVALSPDLEGRSVEVDAAMIARALRAMAGHAVSPPGDVATSLSASLGSGGELRFSATGWEGDCSPAQIDRLMDGFRRPAMQAPSQAAAIDLGMPLARAVARMHGGDLEFAQEGTGCRMDLVLPAERLVPEEAP